MLRPRAARWFEILAARDDATLVLEALARTGSVELEARSGAALPAELGEVVPLLAQYEALATRYGAYWPPAGACRPSAFPEPPVASLQRCLATVRAWAQDSEPLILAQQRIEAGLQELQRWQPLLAALDGSALDPALLAGAGPLLQARLFVLPAGTDLALATAGAGDTLTIATQVPLDGPPQLLATGPQPALQALAATVTALKGHAYPVPAWLQADAAANQAFMAQRAATLDSERRACQEQLLALQVRHGLHRAVGDARRLHWVLQNVRALEASDWLCWITGWSSDADGHALQQALLASGGRALLHHAAPPADAHAPLLLSNPPWARPFEIFSRALGMPGATEADPSPLLALAVPLMFGYMFGDVGQGLVLAAGGWWFRHRFPVARLLMVGGLFAAAFGQLFGSVFSLHGLLPALWVHPLDAPLPVLLAPLLGGALLLTLGLGLDALSAFWREQFRRWLLTDAALLVVYLALLATPLLPRALAVAAAAALAFCVGHAIVERRATAALAAIGELVEKTLQILINTLSFARVGAFALAHAGLSSAVVALMDAADSLPAKALVLVLGNVLVIVVEAMVVSIQTTRLVLFEFFTRFMQGQGRAFRPLPAPPFTVEES